jgi:two-component system response regulator
MFTRVRNDKEILLVEDNPDDIELTLRAMRERQIDNPVFVVRDGVEALDYLFRRGPYAHLVSRDLPAVILLDIKLPRLDGHEVLRQLRQNARTRFLPVVMLTSSREERDILASYRLASNSYICKPVDFDQFLETISQLHHYWIHLNETPPLAS